MAIVGRINQYASLNVSGQFNEVGYSTISVGQSSFVTPGTYSWTVPAGVTSISVVTVGGGGGGALGDSGGAGGGGALAYVNHISVTPGETLTVGVGTSGIGATSSSGIGSIAFNGGNSYLKRSATSLVEAGGGKKGNNILIDGNGLGGAGGTVIVGTGGSGGKGGDYDAADGMGGGGAGGYSGSGGVGASPNVAAGAGSGGGGGGGATSIFPGAGGGGVGINGEGPSGLGGVSSGGGGGGSGGENGEDRPSQTRGGNGGKYGGGGATGDSGADISGFGASGAVRIIWGLGRNRQFPATNTTDLSGTYAKANISGLGTYTALEFTENIGVSTLTLNTYPAYDLFEDEFAGVLYGLGKGTYARQNLNGSVDVYNEINELDLTPTIVFTPSVTSLNENGTIDFSIATTNVEDGVQLYYEIITPTPTATLTQSATSVMSGTSISFDATTVNVGNGTTLSYDIVGIASSSDFADNTLVGIITVTGGIIDTITKTAAGSGDKTFTLNLRSQGNILASSSVVTITKAQLYDFTSFTFTNATAQGTTGPTLLNLQSAYSAQSWASNTSYLNLYSSTQGYQYWAVPADGTYRITAVGAQGGAVPNSSYGGFGAIMRATIPLIMGDYLIFVVGQRGGYSGSGGSGSGGGGGTFVFKNNLFLPFLIAGGGGGVTNTNTISNALTTNSGANSSNGNIGGTGGNGGNSSSNSGGGGAGLTGNGGLVQSSANVDSGKNITTGSGVGGRGGTCGASSGTNNFNNLGRDQGGFGGGGGGEWCTQGSTGGGGGYSGGAAGNNSASGGGGSYVNPSLATLIGTSNGLYNGTGTYQNLGFNGSFLTADFSNSMGYVTVEKIS